MTDEDWVQLALNDDVLVVNTILAIKQALKSQLSSKRPPSPALTTFRWSRRGLRSKKLLRKKDIVRHSPTSPFSFSAATTSGSGGGGGEGFEETSLPCEPIETVRSKVVGVTTSETPNTKRPRKKKTLQEHKEEESLLLKEREDLKNQLATLQFNLDDQRRTNERLKRLKMDLLSNQTPQPAKEAAKTDEANLNQQQKSPSEPTFSSVIQKQEVGVGESSFMLPDLNLPLEDSSVTGGGDFAN